jgi:hypothetical protein
MHAFALELSALRHASRFTLWIAPLLFAACAQGGDGNGSSAPLAAVSAAAAPSTLTGLDFPGSAGVSTTMRFKFARPDLNGLPIYGPSNAGVTYIWRAYPRRQRGYYTAFFWGNDDFPFTWHNGDADTYYGAHPYPWPDEPIGSTHKWEIAVDAGDVLGSAVVYDRWYTQAFRVWADATGKHHEFYWDLPNTDPSHVVVWNSPPSKNNVNPPSPALTWGDAPWAPGGEVWCGILRGFQIYAAKLSLSDLQSEVGSPLSTAAGASSVWYLNLNPTPGDISDKSGRGHHPVWVGNERPRLYSADSGAPLAANDSHAAQSGVLLSVPAPGVLGNDTNPNGGALSAVLVSGTSNGTLSLNADGGFSYVPNAGFTGSDSFSYQASNGGPPSDPAIVTLTVSATNRPPTAVSDSYAGLAGSTLTVQAPGILGNDTDPDGGALSAVLVSGTASGVLALNPNGGFSYVPAAGFTGTDSFTYHVSDGALQSNVVTVTLTVGTGHQPPIAANDSYTAPAGSTLTVPAPGVLSNDTDPDGGALSAVLVSSTTNGTLTLNPDGSFGYVPNAGFTGSDSFSYQAAGSALMSKSATVTLTVNASTGPFTVFPASMTYTGTVNGPPQDAGVTITNNRSTNLKVTWNDNIWWLVATSGDVVTIPPGGSASIIHTASMAGVSPGTYRGTATLRGGGVTQRIAVTLIVK